MKTFKEIMLSEEASVCSNYSDDKCSTGCLDTTKGEVKKEASCPFSPDWEVAKKDCSCYK